MQSDHWGAADLDSELDKEISAGFAQENMRGLFSTASLTLFGR